MANIIELHDINKSYLTGTIETPVLFDINLDIKAETLNSIIGQSGSGKTTLMNIVGILDKPTTGEVWIGGVNLSTLKANELARLRNQTIGFIFQFHSHRIFILPLEIGSKLKNVEQ